MFDPLHHYKNEVCFLQVDKSNEEEFSASQRRGRIYLQKFRQQPIFCGSLDQLQESSETLDHCQEPSGTLDHCQEPSGTLDVIQILDTAAILDLKWSPDTWQSDPLGPTDFPVLASGDAKGDIVIYGGLEQDQDEPPHNIRLKVH